MHDMRLSHRDGQQVVNVGWKALKARLVAHKAMDVYQQQGPSLAPNRFNWPQ